MECNCSTAQWTLNDPSIDLSRLEPCLQTYANEKGSLIAILQTAQELYGYLPTDLLIYIARRTDTRPSKVMGVVSFYTQFRTTPVGKHLILLCQGTACHVNNSSHIEEIIQDFLQIKEGEISEDGLFTYNNVACLGCCSLSPVMMIGDKAYGNLTKDKTIDVLKTIRDKETV